MESENLHNTLGAVDSKPATSTPDKILKKIVQGWIAGLFLSVITLVLTFPSILRTLKGSSFSAWGLFDVALILGLSFGIYKKSRTCAVLLLLYFAASKILIMVEEGKPTELGMVLIFGYLFWQGVSGTFSYHKFLKNIQKSSQFPPSL